MAWGDFTNPEAWKSAMANLLRRGDEVGQYIQEAPQKVGQSIVEAGQRQSALMNEAFDPTGKTLIKNPQAANQAAMNLFEGPLGFAPAGITKLPSNYQELQGLQNELYEKVRSFNKPSQIPDDLKSQYFDVKKALDKHLDNPKNVKEMPVAVEESYKGQHQAPMRDSGKPLHDLTDIYPEDFYSSKAVQYYGTGDPNDYRVISQLQYLRNKPNESVWMYRAVPKNAPSEINKGDWVTIDRNYAKEHGDSALNGDYKIIKRKATAKDLYTNGDSPYEMGYDPTEAIKKIRKEILEEQVNKLK